MRREGRIVLNEKDIKATKLSKDELHQKIMLYYQSLTQQGIEKFPVRVFAKRKAIEIEFIGRSVVDADIISLQNYLSLPIIQTFAENASL